MHVQLVSKFQVGLPGCGPPWLAILCPLWNFDMGRVGLQSVWALCAGGSYFLLGACGFWKRNPPKAELNIKMSPLGEIDNLISPVVMDVAGPAAPLPVSRSYFSSGCFAITEAGQGSLKLKEGGRSRPGPDRIEHLHPKHWVGAQFHLNC